MPRTNINYFFFCERVVGYARGFRERHSPAQYVYRVAWFRRFAFWITWLVEQHHQNYSCDCSVQEVFHFPSAFNSTPVLPPCLRRRSAVSALFLAIAAVVYKVWVMLLRLIHALFGAFFGAVFGVANTFWIFGGFNLKLVFICAGISGVFAFVWGEPFIQWLKENLWEWLKWWD